jgi:formate dehydrogenase beta subunit
MDFSHQKYPVEIRDFNWYRAQVPCMEACPVHTDSGKYVQLIAEGNYLEAYLVARSPNPIASICARVCAAPCEDACRRGKIDEPVSIRALKRFVTEKFGPESSKPDTLTSLFGGISDAGSRRLWHSPELSSSRRSHKERIAVIGSGAAGLACAHDLALMGYNVTVFEASSIPGGMARLGIPEYRLPRGVIEKEISAITALGVELRLNSKPGRGFGLKELREFNFDAIFIATGLMRGRELNIEGVDLDGVVKAIEFLLNVNRGFKVNLGHKVLVVGGGSVALDAARTAVRLHYSDQSVETQEAMVNAGSVHVAIDVARSAMRAGAEVTVASIESFEELPAAKSTQGSEEMREAMSEGIKFVHSRGPKRVLGKDGRVIGIEMLTVDRVFDKQGRFNPSFIPNTEETYQADTIILAIGQEADLSFLTPEDGVEVSPNGLIKVNPKTMETSAKGIFAGGDIAFGARILIEAAANGKQAAQSIHNYLREKNKNGIVLGSTCLKVNIEELPIHTYHMPEGYECRARQSPPMESLERRTGISEIEDTYAESDAKHQAERCLVCHINTIYNSERCILCGACVDVCPEYCLKIVPAESLELKERDRELLWSESALHEEPVSAMIKDDTNCIRCGLCAQICPVQAITMEQFSFVEEQENAYAD